MDIFLPPPTNEKAVVCYTIERIGNRHYAWAMMPGVLSKRAHRVVQGAAMEYRLRFDGDVTPAQRADALRFFFAAVIGCDMALSRMAA